jgi:1-deoxy-D-xylulose-5-phosphate reductoisomerase
MVTTVSILGATGSIGTSALDLMRDGAFRVVALTANSDAKKLASLAKEFDAEVAAVSDESAFAELKAALAGTRTKALAGAQGMAEAAAANSDILLSAIVGAAGLVPTIAGFAPGRKIALANKECLVTAGSLFMSEALKKNATVLPVDSEHNAVFQALACGKRDAVSKVTLTASGGPFRTMSRERLAQCDAGRSGAPSELVDGREDFDRFRDADEQRAGVDRGTRICSISRRRSSTY